MACVIPFPAQPARPATARRAQQLEWIKAYAALTWTGASEAPPAPAPREEEILTLLRRIERILSQLDVPGGAGRTSGSAGTPAMPPELTLTMG